MNFKKTFVSTFFLASIFLFSQAQIIQPVTWSISAKKVDKEHYDIICEAQVEMGWHLYSTEEYEDGPLPTVMILDSTDHYVIVDSLTESPKPKKQFDDMFGVEVGYHDGQAKFVQRIKILKEGDFKITGVIEGQACDDSNCVLVDADIDLSIKGEGENTAANNESASPPLTEEEGQQVRVDPRAPVDITSRSLWSLFFYCIWSRTIGFADTLCISNDPDDGFILHARRKVKKKVSLSGTVFRGIHYSDLYHYRNPGGPDLWTRCGKLHEHTLASKCVVLPHFCILCSLVLRNV